ncbi:hypothetical protein V6N11_037837 [Hibiscus sabdariffa]|uniref:Uncharacterized protein n=2 Tax=Hibiscus sabdariffa TaxID=183260 RepID=A0ABR2A5L9_9ROSI
MALNCSARKKLEHLGADLAVWQSKRRRRAVHRRNALQSRIDHLLVQPITEANMHELRSSKKELHGNLTRDQHYWRQCSRVAGLGNGNCPLGCAHLETGLHAFQECSYVQEVFVEADLVGYLPNTISLGKLSRCL